MAIKLDPIACCGCRACELICSYHHIRAFSPGAASIKVSRNNRTGIVRWTIADTCDFCRGEGHPLCVQFCTYGALQETKQ